jgi:hypothetical protein
VYAGCGAIKYKVNIRNGASKWALLGSVSVFAALAMASSAQAACTSASATVTVTGLSAIRLNSTHVNLRIDGTVTARPSRSPSRTESARWYETCLSRDWPAAGLVNTETMCFHPI